MYMDQMISVGKATNGFVIECRVRFKKDAKKTEKMSCCCVSSDYGGSCEKQYIAKDEKEVAALIADIMPLLDGDYKSESEYDAAFEAACNGGEMESENGSDKD